MTVKEAIETRRSVRSYKPEPVAEEVLLELLESARIAPSAANGQQWKFILVRDPEKLKVMYTASEGQKSVAEAPAFIAIVATGNRVMMCNEPTATVDSSIAMSFLLLRAHELGLGMCWLGHFDDEIVKKALNVPEGAKVVACSPVGYPAESPEMRPRKEFAEVVSFDSF